MQCIVGAGARSRGWFFPLSSLGLCMYGCRCAQRASSAMSNTPERLAKGGRMCIAFLTPLFKGPVRHKTLPVCVRRGNEKWELRAF